jgi:hypothetical protein
MKLPSIDGIYTRRSPQEYDISEDLKKIHKQHIDKYGPMWNMHSLNTIERQTISRLLHYNDLYKMILGRPGVICEFGVLWGATLSQLISFRGIYEPYNHRRHIYGFDSFEGFKNVDEIIDGKHLSNGDLSVTNGYEEVLESILMLQEGRSPLSHIKKFSIVKGDVSITVPDFLSRNPHLVIALAIFDLDLYVPTRDTLQAVIPRLAKGSVVVFDEFGCDQWPGETQAIQEVLGVNNIKFYTNPHQPNCAWCIWGE